MRSKRPNAPDWLDDNWESWGEEYKLKLDQNTQYSFSWKQHKGEKVNKKLLPLLKSMTDNHCSFCDGFPMGEGVIKETIEHFRPKKKFPLLAYQWENLFLACHFCQEKGDEFDELLLKPDDVSYDFDRYFIFNFRTFKVEVRQDPGVSIEEKKRAETTLRIYKINEFGRPKAREREFRKFNNMSSTIREMNDYSFRYMFLLVDN
jgi:uncharacterized protein (TIGR02646 family)